MSKTPKINRVWNKQEKRIIRLLYRKGFISNLEELYWNAYKDSGKKYKKKYKNGCNFKHSIYLDEIHFCTCTYWGECNEYSFIDNFIEKLIDEGISDEVYKECGFDYYKAIKRSSFQYKGRKWFIKYLSNLPTVRCDLKVNKILKISN